MKRLTTFNFERRSSRPKRESHIRECCRSKKGNYHLPDCPIGFPVINKPTEESIDLWMSGVEVPVFHGNQI